MHGGRGKNSWTPSRGDEDHIGVSLATVTVRSGVGSEESILRSVSERADGGRGSVVVKETQFHISYQEVDIVRK